MGLRDLLSVVTTEYRVKTDQWKAGVREMSGEQKKQAKEIADAMESQSKALDQFVTRLTVGTAAIAGGFLVARNTLQSWQERSDLVAATSKVNMDALAKATDGLRSRTQQLTIAQAGAQGAWKLTTEQLVEVVEGMRALEKKGFDSSAVFDRFTEVLRKGKLEGLDQFGLSLESTGDQTQDLHVLMTALRSEVQDVGGDFTRAGDDVRRTGVMMEDALEGVRVKLGALVKGATDFAEMMGKGYALLIGGNRQTQDERAADVQQRNLDEARATAAGRAFSLGNFRDAITGRSTTRGREDYQLLQELNRGDLRSLGHRELLRRRNEFDYEAAGVDREEMEAAFMKAAEDSFNFHMFEGPAAIEKLKKIGKETFDNVNAALYSAWLDDPKQVAAREKAAAAATKRHAKEQAFLASLGSGIRNTGLGLLGGFESGIDDFSNLKLTTEHKYLEQSAFSREGGQGPFATGMDIHRQAEARRKSLMASVFGTPEEISATTEALSVASGVIDIFASSASSAMDAWIKGEEGAGQALRRGIAGGLGAIAGDLAAKSTRHLIEAGAHLFFDPLGAARHAGAAAVYGAGALTMGGLAKAMHPSAHVPGGRGGGAAAAGLGSGSRFAGGGGGGTTTNNFFLGDTIGWQTQRTNAIGFREVERRARQYQPPPSGVAE
jgi:hypothetical protein